MRNHFLRAKGVPAAGGGGGGGGSCGANDSGGTNEWSLATARGGTTFVTVTDYFTSSIDTANKISYLAGEYASTKDLYIRKVTNTGTLSWSKKFNFSGTDYSDIHPQKGHSLSDGKQIIAGQIKLSSSHTACFWCVNADGTVEWCKRLTPASGSSMMGNVWHLTVDDNDNIYAILEQFEATAAGNSSNVPYFFAIKLNSSGALQWNKRLKPNRILNGADQGYASGYIHPNGIAVDSNYLYISNYHNEADYLNIFVLNTSNGTVASTKWVGKNSNRSKMVYWELGNKTGSILKKDSSGDFYLLIPSLDSSNVANRLFLMKFDSSFNVSWSREITVGSSWLHYQTYGYSLAITENTKDIVIASNLYKSSTAMRNIVAVFNSSGVLQWQRSISGVGGTEQRMHHGMHLDADNADHFYLTYSSPYIRTVWFEGYFFGYTEGAGIIKHSACSAIPTGHIVTCDPNNQLGNAGGDPDGWAEIHDDTILSDASSDWEINSSAYTDISDYVNSFSTDDPTGDFTAHTQSTTVSDVASGDNYYCLETI